MAACVPTKNKVVPTAPTTQTIANLLMGLLFIRAAFLQANCCFIRSHKEYSQANQQYLEGKNKIL